MKELSVVTGFKVEILMEPLEGEPAWLGVDTGLDSAIVVTGTFVLCDGKSGFKAVLPLCMVVS